MDIIPQKRQNDHLSPDLIKKIKPDQEIEYIFISEIPKTIKAQKLNESLAGFQYFLPTCRGNHLGILFFLSDESNLNSSALFNLPGIQFTRSKSILTISDSLRKLYEIISNIKPIFSLLVPKSKEQASSKEKKSESKEEDNEYYKETMVKIEEALAKNKAISHELLSNSYNNIKVAFDYLEFDRLIEENKIETHHESVI